MLKSVLRALPNPAQSEAERRKFVTDLIALAAAAALALALSMLMAVLSARDPLVVENMLLDRAEWDGKPFYLGAISQFGILTWAAAAAIGFFAFAQRRAQQDARPIVSLLFFASALTACLCIDDLLQLHEVAGPKYLGIGQKAFYLFYALSAVALGLGWWREILGRPVLPLIAGAAFFASIVVDLDYFAAVIGTELGNMMVEESLKFFGILLWGAYLVRTAFEANRGSETGTLGGVDG